MTIENSSFHDIDDSAVVTMSNQSAPFVTVKANSMETAGDYVQWGADGSLTGNVMNGGYELVIQGYGSGTVSGNTVANSLFSGITVDSFAPTSVSGNTFANSGTLGMYILSSATISSNTVTNSPQGIYVDADGVSVTSNKISNASGCGIFVGSSGDTFQSNTITKTSIGIEFNCLSATVLHNTINDATTGIDSVPGSFSGANSFDNAVTLRTGGCGFGPIHGPDLPKAPHSGPMPARVAH